MNDIYTRQILRLAASIEHDEKLDNPDVTVSKTSRICGSTLTIHVCKENGRITAFAQEVKACAIGQACANVVARNVIGLTKQEMLQAADAFEAMIKDGADPIWPDPKWQGLEVFKNIHGNSSRYGSIMLPFECLKEVF